MEKELFMENDKKGLLRNFNSAISMKDKSMGALIFERER